MNWFVGVLGGISIVGIWYALRYYLLISNMKKAQGQMKEIQQNPEDNRILLVAHSDQHVEQFLESCNDYITSNQKLRIQYAARERKLRRQIEAMSHDLRTPLTAMLGYLELLDVEGMSEENRESFEVVQRKAKGLQGLISNFYDLSRLELDDYHIEPIALELGRFVKEGMLQSYSDFEQRGLGVEITCVKPVFVRADLRAMERILSNMIQNALRYAKSYLEIVIKEDVNGSISLIFANDTDQLKEEDIAHLFERFYMSDSARSGQGTGLGLTISKLLAQAMGGTVQAQLLDDRLEIQYSLPKSAERTK